MSHSLPHLDVEGGGNDEYLGTTPLATRLARRRLSVVRGNLTTFTPSLRIILQNHL